MSRKVITVSVTAAVALLAVWYLFVFSKQSSTLHSTKQQVSAQQGQAAALRQQIAVLEQEKTGLAAAQANLNTLDKALPSTPALDKLIDDINGAAIQAGVDWKTLTPTKPATFSSATVATASGLPAGMQAVTVGLQASGTYQQILAFITNLNAMPRLLDVESVSLSSVNQPGPTTAQINTQMFFVPTAGAATTTTTTP